MKKNDIIKLDITGMTAEGSGVGRYEGMAVFVERTAPGDTLEALVLKVKKTYAYAKAVNIITPSPARVQPDCPVFSRCGGCAYKHINYEAELKIKQDKVSSAFERIAGEKISINPIIASPERSCYRNKAQFPVGCENGHIITGFYSQRSHRIIKCDSCSLQPRIFSEIVLAFRQWADNSSLTAYDENTESGLLRHIFIRSNYNGTETVVTIVTNGRHLPKADILWSELSKLGVTGLVLNVNTKDTNVILGEECITLFGKPTITDTLCGLKFEISPLSFYQVNRDGAEILYTLAAEYASLTPDTVLLDIYCGAGTIGLTMSKRVKKVIGVEIIPDAAKNAEHNAEINGITNAEFICDDAAEAAVKLSKRNIRPEVIIVDPPRKGCEQPLIETICKMSPERIVYVSCDPATLARDCRIFKDMGYSIPKINGTSCVTPVDMFPFTKHVETVCLMSRVEGK